MSQAATNNVTRTSPYPTSQRLISLTNAPSASLASGPSQLDADTAQVDRADEEGDPKEAEREEDPDLSELPSRVGSNHPDSAHKNEDHSRHQRSKPDIPERPSELADRLWIRAGLCPSTDKHQYHPTADPDHGRHDVYEMDPVDGHQPPSASPRPHLINVFSRCFPRSGVQTLASKCRCPQDPIWRCHSRPI